MANEALERIMADLDHKLALLGTMTVPMRADRIAAELESIRRTARDCGLDGLAALAHACETALARRDGGVLLAPWLEAMRGTLAHDPFDPALAQRWTAALVSRYYA